MSGHESDRDRVTGPIELTDHGVEITHAPDMALMTPGLLAGFNPRALHIAGEFVTFGYPKSVTYRIVGWDAEARALMLEREVG